MKTLPNPLGPITLLLALAAPTPLLAGSDDVALQVNGAAITERDVSQLAQMTSGRQPSNPAERRQVINELTIQELWAQQAVKGGLDKDPDFSSRLANIRRSQLAKAAIRQYQLQHPITEQQLKDAYQALLKQEPSKEYKARHILVKTREEAEAVIVELNKGADFAELAKQRSIGPSGVRGGDLGWFSLTTMVKPFSDAVASVKKGDYSKAPIQTDFGWHVILLEDYRDKQPPTFEEVKPRLEAMLQQQALRERVMQLKNAARVEVK